MVLQESINADPNNPRVWYIRGVSALYTPPMFGGGADKANEYLHKSVKLFEEGKPPFDSTLPTWGHGEAYGWLTQVQLDQDSLAAAEASLGKGLKVDPKSAWLTYELAPKIEAAKVAKAQAADSAKATMSPKESATVVPEKADEQPEKRTEKPEEKKVKEVGKVMQRDTLK